MKAAIPLALALLAATASSAQAQVRPPTASFSWSVPARYDAGWRAWSERDARYDSSYLNPGRWPVEIDACGSSGGGDVIADYAMRIDGPNLPTRIWHSTDCRRTLFVPRPGTYQVTVRVQTAGGLTAAAVGPVAPRDHLIVSLGDSMASGEGVPDDRGSYEAGSRLSVKWLLLPPSAAFAEDLGLHELRKVNWRDDRCHRSALSGHALAAAALERRDPHSSVTFVSLACSGAQIDRGLLEEHNGRQPPAGAEPLPPQVVALAATLRESGRTADAILLSVGANDVGFATIIADCVAGFEPLGGDGTCVNKSGTRTKLENLGGKYDQLATALEQFAPAEVYVTDYPASPFGNHRGACGLLGQWPLGIDGTEGDAFHAAAYQLNRRLFLAAGRNGWNWVDGLTERFEGHDYCAGDSYFRSFEESVRLQGGVHGTAHPNEDGHKALSELLAREIVLGRPALPHWRATITVEQVKLAPLPPTAPPANPPQVKPGIIPPVPVPVAPRLQLKLFAPGTEGGAVERVLTVPKAGVWHAVPPGALRFELDVFDAPRPPRYATEVRMLATIGGWHTIVAAHSPAEAFGVGRHEVLHAQGHGLRYRIDLRGVTS